MILDFLHLVFALIAQLWQDSRGMFLATCGAGLALGGLSWWFASWVAANFNRQFSLHWQHRLFCAITAATTLVCTLLFVTCRYTGPVAVLMVEQWKRAILQDDSWSNDTFRQAYDAVYALRDAAGKQLENFAKHPRPDTSASTTIPTVTRQAQQTAAQVHASGAVEHFRANHPFLSTILWPHPDAAKQAITKDMEQVFASGTNTYHAQDAIQIASENILVELKAKASRIVVISRAVLVAVFLLVQAITIGLLIRAALADIPEHRASPRYIGG
ncbi:hypothetical protein [Solidesulfovibrio sp.]|uniref:hypothetical protein n=1 Tax=Solidesulfovibrio sp. TaxID=2910990 RepID=UPI00260FD9A1|nr:hypothetical protein [Solidesulfovibrio sp.]